MSNEQIEDLYYRVIPIGIIIQSSLNFEQFCKEVKQPPPEKFPVAKFQWLPCDGRSCSETKYAEVTGEEDVPDLRGLFLRALMY